MNSKEEISKYRSNLRKWRMRVNALREKKLSTKEFKKGRLEKSTGEAKEMHLVSQVTNSYKDGE